LPYSEYNIEKEIENNIEAPTYKEEGGDKTEYLRLKQAEEDGKILKVKYDLDQKEKAKLDDILKSESHLQDARESLRVLREDKLKKLSEYNNIVQGLIFEDNGQISYNGTNVSQLSTSQVVELGSKLHVLYKDNLLGLELIDRAESLGDSVFNLYEKAKEEKTTILATVVRTTPAETPQDIGVFYVKDGTFSQTQ